MQSNLIAKKQTGKSVSKNETKTMSSQVAFTCFAPNVKEIFVAGTFNNWDPSQSPLKKDKKGHWHIALELTPGAYEYKFLVDGAWSCYPGYKADEQIGSDCIQNKHGSLNRELIIDIPLEQLQRNTMFLPTY